MDQVGRGVVPNAPIENRARALFKRTGPLVVLVSLGVVAIALDLHHWLSIDALRDHRQTLTAFVARNGAAAGALFMLVYVTSTALSLPGGAALSLAAGLLFGVALGGAYVVCGATVGAVLVFLIARSALGEILKKGAGKWFAQMEAGFQRNAFSYLLTLRLIPIFPFFVVNLVSAFLGVKLRAFAAATFIGIVPGSLVFTYAGSGLGSVLDSNEALSLTSVLTPDILIALTGLGSLALLPILYRHLNDTP
jgi:uncharacterized membrane protein YdjX (TVP38/TMEM64 family)